MSIRSRAFPVLVALVLGVAALTGCAGEENGDSAKFRILVVGGFTGPFAVLAEDAQQGLEAEAQHLNDAGGIDGRKVEVETLDSGGDPNKAVASLQSYIAKNGAPDLLAGAPDSASMLAMAPIAMREKILTVAAVGAIDLNDPSTYPYFFGLTTAPSDQVADFGAYLKERGYSRVALMFGNNPNAEVVSEAVRASIEAAGISITDAVTFDDAELDLSSSLQRALRGNPDAVVADGQGDSAPRVLDARVRMGATDVPMLTGTAMASSNGGPLNFRSTESATDDLEMLGWKCQGFVPEADRETSLVDFLEGTGFGGDDDGASHSLLTAALYYDGLTSIALAAEQAGSTDADALRTAMEQFDAPAQAPWVCQDKVTYTSESHFPTKDGVEMEFFPPAPLRQGMYEVGQS